MGKASILDYYHCPEPWDGGLISITEGNLLDLQCSKAMLSQLVLCLWYIRNVCAFPVFFLNCFELFGILDKDREYDIPRKYDISMWQRATEAGAFLGTCELHMWHNWLLSGNTVPGSGALDWEAEFLYNFHTFLFLFFFFFHDVVLVWYWIYRSYN